ncbi:MAG: LptF/LptG family permease [Porphyromonas sp.]|uniref:LptF/LptG family permease n=1 Tax=Porphyromonas sp. TaxID=1924944 RepID=UPI002A825D37|nr:LptF/LptG family permease [Porphyromonas sp.]MDY4246345.1 LptF/LptG family permease [Porphyromonas sp.]
MQVRGMRLRPKIMHIFMVRSFLPLLLMTLLICWFVVLMQFLWQHIDDLVGKGMDVGVLLEVIFYAGLYVLPTAVPLGVLLASLMTFGNLGERLELLAMKSAGVPLSKIMKPLVILVTCIALGLFVYLDRGVQKASVRVYQILFSARYARPELELPKGIFFNGIDGYSIYVGDKDAATSNLYNVMIYDLSEQRTPRIILADTGRLLMDDSKLFLIMSLRSGESFEQLSSQTTLIPGSQASDERPASYIKEHFTEKVIFIPFDANFEMMGDDYLKSQFVGKNLRELINYSDSTRMATDSVGRQVGSNVLFEIHTKLPPLVSTEVGSTMPSANLQAAAWLKQDQLSHRPFATVTARRLSHEELLGAKSGHASPPPYTIDTLMDRASDQEKLMGYKQALEWLESLSSSVQIADTYYDDAASDYRVNAQEMHRKFTFPVACLLFFFVGAPLGAIVRKGGVGTPMVLAVLIFIVYYVIDTFGLKMINSGQIPVWAGMWLSSAVILPLGAFLTYKASRDSATLNADAYVVLFRRIFHPNYSRQLEYKEIIMQPATSEEVLREIGQLQSQMDALLGMTYAQSRGLRLDRLPDFATAYQQLYQQLEETVETLHNYPDKYVFAQLLSLPMLGKTFANTLWQNRLCVWICIPLLPISLLLMLYLGIALRRNKRQLHQMPPILNHIVKQIESQTA